VSETKPLSDAGKAFAERFRARTGYILSVVETEHLARAVDSHTAAKDAELAQRFREIVALQARIEKAERLAEDLDWALEFIRIYYIKQQRPERFVEHREDYDESRAHLADFRSLPSGESSSPEPLPCAEHPTEGE
jgi:hypothetical protein